MSITGRRRILFAAPFVVCAVLARLAVGPIGDRVGLALAHAAPAAPTADEDSLFDSDDPAPPTAKASPSARVARDKKPVVVQRAKSDAGTSDAGVGGTIVVPRAVVAQALVDRSIHARNAVDEDGKPVGARIHGVSRYGAGLRDGDVIVSVAGTPTPTTDSLVIVAMAAVGQGATSIQGKILRDGALWNVVLEVPPPPKN